MTKVMMEAGRNDLIFTWANKTDFPSYGHFLELGYTTWYSPCPPDRQSRCLVPTVLWGPFMVAVGTVHGGCGYRSRRLSRVPLPIGALRRFHRF